ncbi:Polysaccharide lyase family 4 domain III, partial [Phytophthora infestans]
MLSGRLFRSALLLTSGLLAVVQANQPTSNLNFESFEERAASTSFGYKEDGASWVIDSGAGLTVKVDQGTCDIASMIWNKAELQTWQRKSHINSGLGKIKTSIESLKDKTIQISCKTPGLEHTYLFRPNENVIYMGTYHTKEYEMGNLRFIARLARKPMDNPMVPECKIDNMTPIEGHDVFADSKGITASKFYSGIPFIDDKVHGVTGDAGGVFFIMSDYAYERSTTASASTDPTLIFNDGKQPAVSDVKFDFFQDLNLTGFVPETDRGTWTGTITDKGGVLSNSSVVVGFSNADAQYWVKVDSTTKPFTSPKMVPGTYNTTIYKNQLPVSSEPITIASGSAPADSAKALTVTYEPAAEPLWRIGAWDGTPEGFLNADRIYRSHPSDSRMKPWKPLNFTIGTD